MSDLILVADSHLREEDEATEAFLGFLRREGPSAETVILVGDIFDLWVARQALELPVHRLVVDALDEMCRLGMRFKYVQGNRDYFVADRYRRGPFAQVAEESLVEEHGGRRIHVAHGDLVNLDDRQYLTWRRFSRSVAVRTLFGMIPSAPARRFSLYLERRFRTTNAAFRIGFPDAHARRYAERAFGEGADMVVLGHFHQARTLEFEGGRRQLYVLPGWREDRAYLRVDGSGHAHFVDV